MRISRYPQGDIHTLEDLAGVQENVSCDGKVFHVDLDGVLLGAENACCKLRIGLGAGLLTNLDDDQPGILELIISTHDSVVTA